MSSVPLPTQSAVDAPSARDGGGASASASVRVVKNSLWLIAQPLLMNALSIAQVAYMARVLGRTEYGKFIFALAFVAMFMPLTNLGLRTITVREIASTARADVSRYAGRVLALRVALSVLATVLCAVGVALFGGSVDARGVVYATSALILCQAVMTTAIDVFQAFEEMRYVAQVQFISGLLLTVLSVVAVYVGWGLWGVVASYVVGNLVGAVVAAYYLVSRFFVPRVTIDLAFWRSSLKEGAPLFFPNLILQAGLRAGMVMLGALAGGAAVGTFGVAAALVEKVAVIPDGVCSAVFPTLAALFVSSPADARGLYRKFFGYFVVLSLPIAVGTTLLAYPITSLVYGDKFRDSAIVLAVLAWGVPGTFLNMLQSWTASAIRQERKGGVVTIVSTVVYVALSAVLISRFKEVGLAAAGLCSATIAFFLFRPIIRQHLGAASMPARMVSRVLGATAIMAVVTYLVRGWPVWLSIPVGATVYALGVLALRVVAWSEIATFAAAVRGGPARGASGPGHAAPAVPVE